MSNLADNIDKKSVQAFSLRQSILDRIRSSAEKDKRKMSDWLEIHLENYFTELAKNETKL
jgi:hypothetical protein